jgi:vacuolar-type H+-ATPase subunit C/Vma6
METRITGMGAELSRQLHELGTDIEKLQQHADNDTVNETVHALKSAQIRLAAEQARYEITFRQDLADLANELLKRSR